MAISDSRLCLLASVQRPYIKLGFIKNRSYPAVTHQVDEEQDVDYLSSS